MKFDNVTQWVRITSDPSPTRLKVSHQISREVRGQTLQGESEAGRNKDAGCVLSPEKCIVVVKRISFWATRGKADGVHWPEGSIPDNVLASWQGTTGVCDQSMYSWG